jgi:hypothetical protein
MRRSAGATVVCVLLLAQLCLAGDCVDGVTPDCSDAATPCGPNLDGATFDAASSNEASTDAGRDSSINPVPDASGEADASADGDASDQ